MEQLKKFPPALVQLGSLVGENGCKGRAQATAKIETLE
jgi:hypothetical protein